MEHIVNLPDNFLASSSATAALFFDDIKPIALPVIGICLAMMILAVILNKETDDF